MESFTCELPFFLSLLLHTGKCINSGRHIFRVQVIMAHFDREKKVSYKEEMCACLLSSLPLNEHDKREHFQQKRSRVCHLKWRLRIHAHKGTLRSGVLRFVAMLNPSKLCFYLLLLLFGCFGKGKTTKVTPCHRGSGLTRWSPEQTEDRDERMSSASEVKRPPENYFID